MHEWSEYWRRGFKVLNSGPSIVLEEGLRHVDSMVTKSALDIGCGELRNSRFLTDLDYRVRAIDIKTPAGYRRFRDRKISFKECDLREFSTGKSKYSLVVCTSVIQYLDHESTLRLLKTASASLNHGGVICLNFTVDGGLVGRSDSPVSTHRHDPKQIKTYLTSLGLRVRYFTESDVDTSAKTPGFEPKGRHLACDIVAVKN